MKKGALFAGFVLILMLASHALAGSFLDRAGQDHWYQWTDEKGKRNGYSHDVMQKTQLQGKPALQTTSLLHTITGALTNDIKLTLVSTDLEPMSSFSITATEKSDKETFTTTMTGKPDGLSYRFNIDRNGEKKTIEVPRTAFDYFDFEDHYLYSGIIEGMSKTHRVLNSLTLVVEKRIIKNEGTETVRVNKAKRKCAKFTVRTQDFESQVWLDQSTQALIKQTFANGAKIILSTKKEAVSE